MKILLIAFSFLMIILPARAAEPETDRAAAILELFKENCYTPYFTGKRLDLLNSKYKKYNGSRGEYGLEGLWGDLWMVPSSPEPLFVEVEREGDCSVFAREIDAATLHARMKEFTDGEKTARTDVVIEYKSGPKDARIVRSGFKIKSNAGGLLATVVAATPENVNEAHSPAVLHLVVE